MKLEAILAALINNLKTSDPSRIVLFGSHSNGTATPDSDIDLMVILDNDDVAKTYSERLNKKLKVRKLVREINYKVPLDILVYSKEELRLAKNAGNLFLDEIEQTGKVIYEKIS